MRTIYKSVFICILSIGLFACKPKSEAKTPTSSESDLVYVQTTLDSISAVDQLMDFSMCQQYSLEYSNKERNRYFAILYCDTVGNVHRMEEQFSTGELFTRNKLYFDSKGQLFATTSEYQMVEDTVSKFVEELTTYRNGKIERQYRKTTSEFEETGYFPTKDNKPITRDKIMRAINHEGEFSLTFQGIIKTDNLDYLLIGGSGENDYNSALQIEANTPFIQDIYLHEIKYIGRKIAVNFERKQMGNFAYQAFVAGQWQDTK